MVQLLSQESINYVQPQFYTGAEALADWIATESCPLRHLDVSWNTIRLDSAVYFGNAIACEPINTNDPQKVIQSTETWFDGGGETSSNTAGLNHQYSVHV